jgi:hypothetical protein
MQTHARRTHLVLAALCAVLVACGSGETVPVGDAGAAHRVKAVLDIDDDLERIRALAALLQALPPESAEEVVQGFDESLLDRGDIELVLLAQWWVRFDPEAANAWSKSSWRTQHGRISYAVNRALARQDPEKAVEIFYQHDRDASTYTPDLQALLVGWYESGQPGLLAFIDGQPSLELRQQGLGTFARIMVADVGAEAATAWAEALTVDPELRKTLVLRMATAAAEIEPEFTAAWAKRMIEDGESTILLPRVASRWARTDGPAAMAWLETFDRTDDQKHAVRRAYTVWRARRPFEAPGWLMQQDPAQLGEWLAPALAARMTLAADRAAETPEKQSAYDWAANLDQLMIIEDEPLRWGSALKVARLWRQVDPEAAEAWMEANGMPEMYRGKARAGEPRGQARDRARRVGS